MLDNDNIINTGDSETVEKTPAYGKDYRKCSFMRLVCKATAYKQHTSSNIQLTVENVVYLLEQQYTPIIAKKITEDILNKIYTGKGAITGI